MVNPRLDDLFRRAADMINATNMLVEPSSQQQLPEGSSATGSDVESKLRQRRNAMEVVAKLDPQGKYCKKLRARLTEETSTARG